MLSQRQGIVVWLHSLKQAKLLRRYGNVIYISKKLKYVLFYCNSEDTESLVEKLNRQSYVKKWRYPINLPLKRIMKIQDRIKRRNTIIKWVYRKNLLNDAVAFLKRLRFPWGDLVPPRNN